MVNILGYHGNALSHKESKQSKQSFFSAVSFEVVSLKIWIKDIK